VPRNSEARISLVISISTVFGAFSAILAMMPFSFSFPLIPYLKFDIAELPVVTAFLGFGPVPGFISALTYWLVLNVFGEWTPIGPAMKFIAVASMLLGLWVSYKLALRFRIPYISVFIFGSLLRVLATTVSNYLVLVVIAPFFLEFAVKSLSITLGLEMEAGLGGLILVLAFTAVYNVLHVALSLFPSIFLVKNLSKQGLFLNLKQPWIIALIKQKKI
jgi:riboflavin transporter FmnP